MFDIFSNSRLTSLHSYFIILLSLYTIVVLAKPTVTLHQKRQIQIQPTTTTTTTTRTILKSQVTTLLPSKPTNCDGPIELSKVHAFVVYNLNNDSRMDFFAEGTSSSPINAKVFVNASIYWDNRNSTDYRTKCPNDNDTCFFTSENNSIRLNYSVLPLPEELLGRDTYLARSAYLLLTMMDVNSSEILGCTNVSLNGPLTNAYKFVNIPFILAVIAVICFMTKCLKALTAPASILVNGESIQQRANVKSGIDSSGSILVDTSGTDVDGNIHPKDPNPVSPEILSPSSPAQSIYDIVRFAQFIATTGLISLSNLPNNYRDLTSKVKWAIGLLPCGFSKILSKVAEDSIRKAICKMTDFCPVLSNKIAYYGNSPCKEMPESEKFPKLCLNSTGITSYANQVCAPDYNLFFINIISFSTELGIALLFALIIWLVAMLCKSKWDKWELLKLAAKNGQFLMLGAILRVIKISYYPITLFAVYQLTFINDCWLFLLLSVICLVFFSLGSIIFCSYKILRDLLDGRKGFSEPAHKFFYSSLYSEYKDDPNLNPKESSVWFFIVPFVYDFFRAVIIGLSQKSPIAQITGLMVTEAALFGLLLKFKPYESKLKINLKLSISAFQFIIVCLLIPFFSNTLFSHYRCVIKDIITCLECIVAILLASVTIYGLVILIRRLKNKRDDKSEGGDEEEAEELMNKSDLEKKV